MMSATAFPCVQDRQSEDAYRAMALVVRDPQPTDWRATPASLTRRGKSEVARMQMA